MREETRYICAYCEHEYSTPEECKNCENSHEIPEEITEYDFKFDCTKYPKIITVKTVNGRFAQYKYYKPIVPSGEGEE